MGSERGTEDVTKTLQDLVVGLPLILSAIGRATTTPSAVTPCPAPERLESALPDQR